MGDDADEPLIGDDPRREDLAVADEASLTRIGFFIWTLTFTAGLSGLLFGYDTGVISSTLVSVGRDLSGRSLTTLDKSLITSCTSLFALIASPSTGFLADAWGRKNVLLVADVLFILGALWQAFTDSVWGMIGGRSIVGLAVGSASFVGPLYVSKPRDHAIHVADVNFARYIAELSPSSFRGRLVTVSCLMITGGQVVAYLVGWLLSTHAYGWRWMVGIGALPAATQCMIMTFMPETPRWLIKAGRQDEAKRVLMHVYRKFDGRESVVKAVLRRIEQEMQEEESIADDPTGMQSPKLVLMLLLTKIRYRLSGLLENAGNRRALVIACLLQGSQQLCGFNSLMYFSASIFAMVGFTSPTLVSLSIAVTNFLFTLVAFYSIDRIGRRRILIFSIPIMVFGLLLCSFSFTFLNLHSTSFGQTNRSILSRKGLLEQGWKSQSKVWAIVTLVAMVIYVAGYALGLGNVPWQQSELFPLNVRSIGSGLSTTINWASNFVIGLTFLPMMEVFTPSGTFGLYAIICFASWVAVKFIYPETAGLSLEDVGALLKNGWGVKESETQWQARKIGHQ